MNKTTDFVIAAINDTQATIRAIDVKVAAILVGVLAPLQNLHRIFAHLENFSSLKYSGIFLTLSIMFITVWILAAATLVRALGAVDNPAAHIVNSNLVKGVFFSGGLYALNMQDALRNRSEVMAKKDPVSFMADLPKNEPDILKELAVEQMKLVYIREIKMKRLQWGFRFSVVWIILGVMIYISSKYGTRIY